MTVPVPKFIRHQLYLLQLENYELRRYWRLMWQKVLHPSSTLWRQDVVWTPKLSLTFCVAIIEQCFVGVIVGYFFTWWVGVALFLLLFIIYPLVVTLATITLWPLDLVLKQILLYRARQKLKRFPDLRIVAVAGSYGKTTMKEMLASTLSQTKKILVTPENINTPLGIARLILASMTAEVQVFIVEMGEFYPGDIRDICRLTPPDVAVVTGINEAHLERLKNLDSTAATIFEVVTFAKPGALVILNADDELVQKYAPRFLGEKTAQWYSAHGQTPCAYGVHDVVFDQNGKGLSFTVENNEKIVGKFETRLLGMYAIGVSIAGIIIGEYFGVAVEAIRNGISSVAPVTHRLQPIHSAADVLVIDDSYNGNPAGVAEAIQVLGRFTARRKLFLTPGLVEMGERTKMVHFAIGQQLAAVADMVILIRNSVTQNIAEGLLAAGFAKDRIVWFNTAPEAHAALRTLLKPRDIILFQNDWGDNYL